MNKKYKLWKGRKVRIFDLCNDYVGIGEYIGSIKCDCGFGFKYWIPRFRYKKTVYWGHQCWWIPLSDALKLQKKTGRKPITKGTNEYISQKN